MTMAAANLQGGHLHLDCASGAAGDMILGALFDLGVPVEVVAAPLDALGAGRGRLQVKRTVRGGIAAVDVTVETGGRLGIPHGESGHHHGGGHGHDHAHGGDHDHDHDHGHQEGGHGHGHDHVHYRDLKATLERVLDGEVRRRAIDIFDRVARAEAKIHGTTIEEVAFHEVGAIDSVVDIVGIAAALAYLAPESASCASVAMGHGTVRTAHGVLPVPSPAAQEILREAKAVTRDGGVARELCTPTGAAVLAHLVTAWAPMPEGVTEAIGWGAGDAELADRPNVVRAVVLRGAAGEGALWRLEANLDDLTAELAAHAAEALFAAGAIDVWWTPIVMKKGRPAQLLSALVPLAARDRVVTAMFRETTTLGVRFDQVERRVLGRQIAVVETEHGKVEIKLGVDGGAVVNVAPEYESCRLAASAAGVPLKEVYAAAMAAWRRRVAG